MNILRFIMNRLMLARLFPYDSLVAIIREDYRLRELYLRPNRMHWADSEWVRRRITGKLPQRPKRSEKE